MSSRKFRDGNDGDNDDDLSTIFSRTSSSSPTKSSSSFFFSSKSSKDRSDHEQRRRYGAGIASGVIGLMVGGPLFAVVAGLGAAYATDQPGPAGTTARAIGDAALMAQELDQKHHIVEKVSKAAVTSCRVVAQYAYEKKLLEHGIDVVGRAAYWVAERLAEQAVAAASQHQRRLEDN